MVTMRSPYTGGVVTVSVSQVEQLVRAGWMVEESSAPAPVAPPRVLAEPKEEEHETVPVGDEPKGNASRAAWRDYAVSLGIDVEGLNRAQIRDMVTEHETNLGKVI